jgi:chromosome segregation ATPase
MGEFAGYLLGNLPSLAVVGGVYLLIKRQLSDSRNAHEQLEVLSSAQANEIHLIKRDKRELRKEIGMLREDVTNERSIRAEEIAQVSREDRSGAQQVAALEQHVTSGTQKVAELEQHVISGTQKVAELEQQVTLGTQQVAGLEEHVIELAGLVKKHGELSDEFDGIIEKLESLGASVTELVNKVEAREGREKLMVAAIDDRLREFAAERVRYHETLKAAEDKEIEFLSGLLDAQRSASGA